MRKRIGWWLVLVLLALGGGALWYRHRAELAAADHFEVRAVERGDIEESVETTGTIQPVHTVSIGTQVSGQVKKMMADFNAVVHKGQILATIDPSTYLEAQKQAQDDLDSAQASLANARESLSTALSGSRTAAMGVATAQAAVESARVAIRSAQTQYDSAVAGLDKAKASMANDQLTYRRNENLRKEDLVAESDVDTARTAYMLDVAGVQSAMAQLEQSRTGIDSARVGLKSAETGLLSAEEKRKAADITVAQAHTQITMQEASVRRSESSLRTAIINVGYCTIRSPVDGVVITRSADPGQTVAAQYSTPTLYTLATDLHHMRVLASVDESDMGDVEVGQKATFQVDAYPDDKFEGEVTEVRNASAVTNNVVTYQVLITVSNPGLKLRPGMTANLSLLVDSKKDVLLVPNMALRWQPGPGDPTATPTPRSGGGHHHRRDGGGAGDAGGGWGHHRQADGVQRPRGSDDDDATPKPKRQASDDDQPERQQIWVLQDNKAVPQTIFTGITDGSKTEVVHGLRQGDQVVVASMIAAPPAAGPGVRGGRGGGGRRMF